MTPTQIPRFVDAQPQVLLWELDEFILMCGAFVAGLAFKMLTIFLIIGWVLRRMFAKYKAGVLDGALQHIAASMGFAPLNRTFDDLAKREYWK